MARTIDRAGISHAPHEADEPVPDLFRSAATGLLAGALAALFRWAIAIIDGARLSVLGLGLAQPTWGWALLPALALPVGCLIGWLVVHIAPDAPGSGIPHVKAVLRGLRPMGWRAILPVKLIGGALGIGAGLSLGLEGPTVQMGASAAQGVSEASGAGRRASKHLLASGAGAGLAAAFDAPLAGFLFVLEELRRPRTIMTYRSGLVAVICSVLVTRSVVGSGAYFVLPELPGPPLAALPLIVMLGVAGGLVGVGFNRSLLGLRQCLRVSGLPRWILPGIVCAVLGVVAWWLPDATGGGREVAQRLLGQDASLAVGALLVLLVAKFATTVVSYGSGAPGGIFAPLLVIGAVTGVLVGEITRIALPGATPGPSAYAILGMGAIFSASVRAPLTGIALILEMTAEYRHLLALCTTSLAAYLTAEGLRDRAIYDALLDQDLNERKAVEGGRA
jgi:CIC family chloride channel protein